MNLFGKCFSVLALFALSASMNIGRASDGDGVETHGSGRWSKATGLRCSVYSNDGVLHGTSKAMKPRIDMPQSLDIRLKSGERFVVDYQRVLETLTATMGVDGRRTERGSNQASGTLGSQFRLIWSEASANSVHGKYQAVCEVLFLQ